MKYQALALLIVLILHNVVTLPESESGKDEAVIKKFVLPNAHISHSRKKEIFRKKNREIANNNFKTERFHGRTINYDPFPKHKQTNIRKNIEKVHNMKTFHNSHVVPFLNSKHYKNFRTELKPKRFGKIYSNDNFKSYQVPNNGVEDKNILEPNMISTNILQNAFTSSNKINPKRNNIEYGSVREQIKSTDIGVLSVETQDKLITALEALKNKSQDSLEYSYSPVHQSYDDELYSYYNNDFDHNSQKLYPEHSSNYTSEPQSDINYYDFGYSDDDENTALGLESFVKQLKKSKESKIEPKQLDDQKRAQSTQRYAQPFHNRYQPQPHYPIQNPVYPHNQNPPNQLPHIQFPQPPFILPPYFPFQHPPNSPNGHYDPHFIYPPTNHRLKSTTYPPFPMKPHNKKINRIETTTSPAPKLITPNIDTEVDDCEFGTSWTMNCYDCVCNGSTAICIRDLRCRPPPQNEPKLCKPYTSFQLDGSVCHPCDCNADGLPVCTFDYYACSRRTKQKFYRLKEGKNKYLQKLQHRVDSGYDLLTFPILTTSQNTCPKVVIDFNVWKCQPRSQWTARCYTCECDGEGQPVCTKLWNCVPAPFGIPPKCKPGSTLSIEGCRKCWCDDDGFPAGDIPPPKVQGLGAKTKTGKNALSIPLSDALNDIFYSFLNPSFNDTNAFSPLSGSLEDPDVHSSLETSVDDTNALGSLPASIEVTNTSSIDDSDAPPPLIVSLDDAEITSPPTVSLEEIHSSTSLPPP